MHDGIHVEKAGIPSVTICTDSFRETSSAMAAMWGAADYSVVFTEHPVAGLSWPQLTARVDQLIEEVEAILTGK